ncbi:MAG: response regulator transcription factor [Bacteroidia bacterium]|nr:response regulator transcription factor [Bacteroidia bacterium]HQV01681.1 response regulator transcription factor [Bacteroidia bacterium]
MQPIQVLIFDDHAEMRKMYALMLSTETDMICIGAYSNCMDAVKQVDKHKPDVILMDIEMPGKSGIDAVKEIKTAYPDMKIIMQTIFSDDDKIFNSICNGASGYILKNSPLSDFTNAIRQVCNGGAPMSPGIALRVIERFRKEVKPVNLPETQFNLTDKELEILNLLVSGLSYKLIADKINKSYHTVDSHIRKIYEKLHVRSATEAVRKAIDHRIL